MLFDLEKIRSEKPEIYGSKSLRQIANTLFTHNEHARSRYSSVDDWAEREGLREAWDRDDAAISKASLLAEENTKIQQRGVIASTASTVTRGLYGAGEMALRAARAIPGGSEFGDDGILSKAITGMEEFKEETPFLRAKQSSGLGRWLREGGESATTSLSTAATGAIAGGLIGGPAGAIAGGVIGWIAGAPLFGLAEYDSVIEEGMNSSRFKNGEFTREELESAAIKSGVAEAGFEFASNLLDIVFLKGGGKFLTAGARAAAKESYRALITGGIKGTAKRAGLVMAAEVPSELATAAVQTDPHNLITGEEKRWFESASEALGPTIVASLIFGAIGDAGFRSNIKRHETILSHPLSGAVNREARMKSVEAVGKELDRVAPQYSKPWRDNATQAVEKGLPISREVAESDDVAPTKEDLQTAYDNSNGMDPEINEALLLAEIDSQDKADSPPGEEITPPKPEKKPPKAPEGEELPTSQQLDPSKLKPEEVESEIDRMVKENAANEKILTDEKSTADERAAAGVAFASGVARLGRFKEYVKTEPEEAKPAEEPGKEPAKRAIKGPKGQKPVRPEDKAQIDTLEGKYVNYQGVDGYLKKKKDGYHVITPYKDVLVEGGESGRPVDELGLTRMKRPTIKYDEATQAPQKSIITDKIGAYDPQGKTLTRPDGEKWTLTDFNRNDKGDLVSATFVDGDGKEKTIRSAAAVKSFAQTQSIYNEASKEKAPMRERPSALGDFWRKDEAKLPKAATEGRRGAKEDRRIDKEVEEKYRQAGEEDITFDIFTEVAEGNWVDQASKEEISELNNLVGLPEGTDTRELRRFATRWLETYVPIMTGEEVSKREPVSLREDVPPSVDIIVQERFADREGTYTRHVKADVAAKEVNSRIRSYEKIMTCLGIY